MPVFICTAICVYPLFFRSNRKFVVTAITSNDIMSFFTLDKYDTMSYNHLDAWRNLTPLVIAVRICYNKIGNHKKNPRACGCTTGRGSFRRRLNCMKRWISMVVCAALILVMMPLSASAEKVTVASIEAADITVIECADGSWFDVNSDSEWFRYRYTPAYVITLSDGRTVKEGAELGMATGIWNIGVEDGQSTETPWGVGDHTVTVTCGDAIGEFTVTVEETPVASIMAQPVTYAYHADGYYNTYTDPETGEKDTWFYYVGVDPMVEVTFKDGSEFAGTVEQLRAMTGYPVARRLSQSYGNELGIGTHTATAVFMGVRTDYAVTVVDMIDRVEWVTYPDKQHYFYGEYLDLSDGVLRVYFTGGATEDVTLGSCLGQNSGKVMLRSLGREFTVSNITPTVMDGTPVTFSFLDQLLTFEPTVEAPPETVTLAVNDDRTLALTVDDTVMQIERLAWTISHSSSDGTRSSAGRMYTDKGLLDAVFNETKEGLSISLGSENSEIGIYAQSNIIADTAWFHAAEQADAAWYALQQTRGETDRFDGTVPTDSIDDLFRLAIQLYTDYPYVTGDYDDCYDMSLAAAERIMEDAYGVRVDMTTSRYYTEEDGNIHVPKASDGTRATIEYAMPRYVDGEWCAESYSEDGKVYAVTMNDDMKLTSFDVRALGDVSGDGKMSTADARVILSVVAEEVPLTRVQTAAADVDRSGKMTTSDARHILKSLVS